MIEVKNICKGFAGEALLNDISFSVAKGESLSIIGPGACGKSVLLKMILGLIEPDSGVCRLSGIDIHTAKENDRISLLKRVGVAFQQGALFDFMDVHRNIRFALDHMTDHTPEKKTQIIQTLLEGVKLGQAEKKMPFELSGGMQRRVGVARALAVEPEVAFFDEPTSGLDPVTSTIILNMIKDLSSANADTTLVIATSNVEIAMRFADRMIVIRDGKIVADGQWQDLLMNSSDWVKHFLSVRLIGLDKEYAEGLSLPSEFMEMHW